MRRAIRATLLFLPKYSPDLNPTEQVLDKPNHRLRTAAERTRDTLFRAIARNDIDRRLSKLRYPWTNGHVERINRTIKQATVKCLYIDNPDEVRSPLADFVCAFTFVKRHNTLKGLTRYECIYNACTKESKRLTLNPLWKLPRLHL